MQNHAQSTMDGNHAAAHIAYAFTEVAAIFPITPSSPMAEHADEWAAQGVRNALGGTVRVVEMQSEAGAAGALHGALASGALGTTFTSSQGLLLMIPNLYKMAGELLPGVLHVAARAIAAHALSIFGDHQDVMACRQTGAIMLASCSPQEAMDLGCVAHMAALRARLPVIHFFDGFRTSNEYRKIEPIPYGTAAEMLDRAALAAFRGRALNPEHPVVRGTAQNPDIYFQGREAANKYHDAAPEIIEDCMRRLAEATGRQYGLFDYVGAPDAEDVVIAMGSVCDTIAETVAYINAGRDAGLNRRTGAVRVRLYRPFSAEHLLRALPPTVKRIAVLDRTKEPGAPGEPLYLDVTRVFYSAASGRSDTGESAVAPLIVGGRYGLGSKDVTPSQILAVFRNLAAQEPRDRFTIGINDDVTYLSLPEEEPIDTSLEGTIHCKFWGLGSDGTVGANKAAVSIIGDNTDLFSQAYFSYDSKKSGGNTVSHLRFGPKPIDSPYLVYNADYIACHNASFINHIDVIRGLKRGGTFVLNCPWSGAELDERLPADLKRYIAENGVNFYTIDALKLAEEAGLGNRINMVMQAAFFKLANVLPLEQALGLLKKDIERLYGRKGERIVAQNKDAVDKGVEGLRKVSVPPEWKQARERGRERERSPIPGHAERADALDYIDRIQRPMARHEGDDLPVSAFAGMEDGSYPLGTTAAEKRGIAVTVPEWQPDKCIQCNQCSYICPHATIRAFLADKAEAEKAPRDFVLKHAQGKGFEDLSYRIQVSPLDCTGCGNCADICPAPGKALIMKPVEEQVAGQSGNWEYAVTLSEKPHLADTKTLKGSQFMRPLLEFNGACPGCGETPYVRLLTQIFGDRMVIANATGCSSIWAASAPSIAYCTDAAGRGPAWANSLFEDNAEYGYGIYLGAKQNRDGLAEAARRMIDKGGADGEISDAVREWLDSKDDTKRNVPAARRLQALAESRRDEDARDDDLREIFLRADFLAKRSVWLIGGDGWAYDIGYGGVDHVLASGEDVNILVLDTELYSNTGGQASKSTPLGSVAKFAAAGKRVGKKDLGFMAMSYGYVYVAQIAMGASMPQTLRALHEAESWHGSSLVIAYAPCISHGIKTGMGTSIAEEKKAVESGYWQLYRYDPSLREQGRNPFTLDSKAPTKRYKDFLEGEVRYAALEGRDPGAAEELFDASERSAADRLAGYKALAAAEIRPEVPRDEAAKEK